MVGAPEKPLNVVKRVMREDGGEIMDFSSPRQ
jgi:hypothetical protein